MTKTGGSAWVMTWLEEEFAQERSEVDEMLLVPIFLGLVFIFWFCWLWRAKRPQLSLAEGATGSSSTVPTYYSPNANRTLQILLGSEQLKEKRIPYEELIFERLISRGASGEVWVCDYNGWKVAAKRLLQGKDLNSDKVQAFAEEIELSASLVHPNVVEFIGVAWNSLSNLLLVIEFLPNGSLQDYLHKNETQIWTREKSYLALGVAKALVYLHALTPPLIHRDLKAKNVLVSNLLEPKLIDFGVSRAVQNFTMTAGVGTPFWTAPEVLEGERYTEQADIYSFGVLLSELDTCKTPYTDAVTEGGDKARHFQILQEVMAGERRPSFSSGCPPDILLLAADCFSQDPFRRPTAGEVARALANLITTVFKLNPSLD